MNFFGHAVVASEVDPLAAVVLGAMLPDLEAMVDATASRFVDAHLRRGVSLHHVTDAAFHDGPDFLSHQEAARSLLSSSPIRRGPRRAVAHVGVELILDAALNNPSRLRSYVDALETGLGATSLRGVPFLERRKLRSLLQTLARRAAYVTPVSASGVVERLQRALWARPALRLADTELEYVQAWAEQAWQPIHDQSQAWLGRLTKAVTAAYMAAPFQGVPFPK